MVIFIPREQEDMVHLYDTITLTDEIYYGRAELEDAITLSDSIVLSLSLETIELDDTIFLSDAVGVSFSLETIELSDTITLSDLIQGIYNVPYASRIILADENTLVIVTDDNPVSFIKVDISTPLAPSWTGYNLNNVGETYQNAKDVTVNERTKYAYIACDNSLITKISIDDPGTREEIEIT